MISRPHGGRLVNRVLASKRRERILEEVDEFERLNIDQGRAFDAENIAYGVYSPLEGFMLEEEFLSVLDDMRLPNDLPWTIPIVLDIDEKTAARIEPGDDVMLYYEDIPVAVLHVEEIYVYDKERFARCVFKTTDLAHPGVAKVFSMGKYLIGGRVDLINDPPNPFERYTLRPVETRVLFRERGWKTVVGFQTRNVPHLGHEYLQKSALVFVDGLFINPVIGRKKRGDFRDDVILSAYEVLLRNYYPRESAVLSIVRYEMRYAGPREAIHHAIMRKNFGCTHFIVGRDHAGVGNYYGPYEAQEIFKEFPDLGITPLFFREFFYCRKCGAIVNERVCPHDESFRLRFSGTKIREMIRSGKTPPPEFMRPEVAEAIFQFENPFVE
ncbi:MAG: sulfate adenylyltransferase [Candidatus Baldrarchaeia archaeon]